MLEPPHPIDIANDIAGMFLIQSVIVYTVGIKLWMHLNDAGVASMVSTLASFVTCAALVALASEIFYRVVDLPSIAAAKAFWTFMIS